MSQAPSTPDSREASPGGPHRLALVTGASAGIGAAFAERLARDAYDLVLVARRRERLDELAERLARTHGRRVDVLVADLTTSEGVRAVEARIAAEPTLELLVNNAGFGTSGAFADLDCDGEEEEVRLNVLALLRLTHAALAAMKARGHGSVINVSSLAGFQPGPYNATYSATKAFVNAFTQAVSEELRGTGVRLQLLCPGFTRTEFQDVAGVRTEGIPDFAWMSAEAVVEASLAGLRSGDLLVIPGGGNKVLGALLRSVPSAVARRVGGVVLRRTLGK
ncbi:MAG: short-chain dehydrogenase [Proteobacteria bacterium]|nr:MAG: short-chain dehydrogenase [Pseudomonadota bacterium]